MGPIDWFILRAGGRRHAQRGDSGLDASVVFVCEPGPLEAQAVLLAASLRLRHPALALVAAIPEAPSTAVQRILERLGVALAPIRNPVAADYPIGNKVAALGAGRPDGLRVFLDTDTLCLQPLAFAALAGHAFAAKPADIATFGNPETWARLYQRFGLEPPPARMTATVSEALMPPYFNAGVIATTGPALLAATWGETCIAIDAMDDINPRRPWLDQIALPIAVARLRLGYLALGEAWNFPAHMKPLRADAAIVHYHHPGIIAREPRLVEEVRGLLERDPRIAGVVEADTAWAPVLGELARLRTGRLRWRRRSRVEPPRRNLIVSGIPRSGTSYLTKLLDDCANVAAVNEPEILFEWLRYSRDPWVVPILHADLRRRIIAGEAIANKVGRDGDLVEDTAVADGRSAWRPRVRDPDFVLATKNTLAYMARLEGILRLMPDARVALCVRHPLDTLASWQGTFQHLALGDPAEVPVGGLADPFLPARFQAALSAIAAMPDVAWRRAAWWRLLAQEVVRWRGRVTVVRYEDLVADPAHEVARVLGPWRGTAGAPEVRAGARPRTGRRRDLKRDDYAAVAAQCADIAVVFGYDGFAPAPAAPPSAQVTGAQSTT